MRRTAEDTALTRAALLDAALSVFAEQGVDTARLTDIAQRAGVTRGALYHHFTDRADLYSAVVAHSWESITAPVWATLDDGMAAFQAAWLDQLRNDARFRSLLTITVNAGATLSTIPGAAEAKATGLHLWRDRLAAALAPTATADNAHASEQAPDTAAPSAKQPADNALAAEQAADAAPSAQAADAVLTAERAAADILAWMCGTALLAAIDPALLPTTPGRLLR